MVRNAIVARITNKTIDCFYESRKRAKEMNNILKDGALLVIVGAALGARE